MTICFAEGQFFTVSILINNSNPCSESVAFSYNLGLEVIVLGK